MINLDQVTLITPNDEVIGSMDKIEAHRGEGKLHRAISVYLFKKTEDSVDLLIQQRSVKKIVGAGMWANTVCGNVRPTESYEECAYRRLKEELGVTKVEIQPMYKFQYQVRCNEEFSENELDQVFVGWYDEDVSLNPDEAQDYKWINWSELQEKATVSELKKEEFNTKQISINNQSFTLAPWFVWMLGDEKLLSAINSYAK